MVLEWDPASAPQRADASVVVAAITDILGGTRLMSVATVCPDGNPWVHNAFFAFDGDFRLYFLSRPETRHSENLGADGGRVAASVADSGQAAAPGSRRGLQMWGDCRVAAGDTALGRAIAAFSARFPAFAAVAASTAASDPSGRSPRLYVVTVSAYKLFHEPALGTEVWLSGRVRGDSSLAAPAEVVPTTA